MNQPCERARPLPPTLGWALLALGCAGLLDLPEDPQVVAPSAASGDPSTQAEPGDTSGTEPGAVPYIEPGSASAPQRPEAGEEAVPLEPSVPDAGGLPQNGDSGVAQDAAPPQEAGVVDCAGATLFGVCWYVGVMGASCEETCAPHAGLSGAANAYVGSEQQGGSAAECSAILELLGEPSPALPANRTDGVGLGCHLFGAERDPYWLSDPAPDPSSSLGIVSVVCGCTR